MNLFTDETHSSETVVDNCINQESTIKKPCTITNTQVLSPSEYYDPQLLTHICTASNNHVNHAGQPMASTEGTYIRLI